MAAPRGDAGGWSFGKRRGGIRILRPDSQSRSRGGTCSDDDEAAAQIPAHVRPFLVDRRFTELEEAWDRLPEAIKDAIAALVRAAGN